MAAQAFAGTNYPVTVCASRTSYRELIRGLSGSCEREYVGECE
jgi:hypothetical protein